ncbi:alkaline phosphatase family protein, partial [candidate division CSSED10-310 bacterium]
MMKKSLTIVFIFTVLACSANADPINLLTQSKLDPELQPFLPAPRTQKPVQRVLILGFDGFTFNVLDPMIKQKSLPHFQKIITQGTRISLSSTAFPSSAAAWPAIVTGCDSHENGLQSFFLLDPRTYQLKLTNAAFRQRQAIWELASRLGKRSIVVNVPMSYPPDDIDGIMISGLLSPPQGQFTWPTTLSPVLRRLGYQTGYRLFRESMGFGEQPLSSPARHYDLNDVFDITMNQCNVSLHLLDKIDWDFAMVVFTLPDRVQHNQHQLGKSMVYHTYRQMDTLLSAFLNKVPPQTSVLVISDHGFRLYNKLFYLVPWLIQHGFLVLENGRPDWKRSKLLPIDRVGCYATLRWNVKGREASGILDSNETKASSKLFKHLKSQLQQLNKDVGSPVFHELSVLTPAESG